MVRYITINGSRSSRTSFSKNFRTSSGQATPLMKWSIFARGMRNILAFPWPIRAGSLLLSRTIDEKYAFLLKPRPYGLAQAWEIGGPGWKPFQASQMAQPSLAQEGQACPGSRPKTRPCPSLVAKTDNSHASHQLGCLSAANRALSRFSTGYHHTGRYSI